MMFNRTFFRNALSFIAILTVGFAVLFVAEYFLERHEANISENVDVYSDCITNTGDPC